MSGSEAAPTRQQRKDEAQATLAIELPALRQYAEDLTHSAYGSDRENGRRLLDRLFPALEALAAVPVETREAAAPDDYTRPGWRMFPVL